MAKRKSTCDGLAEKGHWRPERGASATQVCATGWGPLASPRTWPSKTSLDMREHLHWADPSMLELIQLLVEQGATARLPLLYTARPEFRAPWPMRAHNTQINLNRLSAGNVRTMVAQVAASMALSDQTVAMVVERAGGVPLFVEELTRAALEGSDAMAAGGAIPVTLHDSLMARLDRLGPAKEVAALRRRRRESARA